MTHKTQRLLISTDLDATLLTEAYDWSAARPALKALARQQAQLVLNSSKTFVEIIDLAQTLQFEFNLEPAPLVAENGTVIALPVSNAPNGYRTECLGLDRATILDRAHRLREKHGYDFRGFADMTPGDLAALTGLNETTAKKAMTRQATEPILWRGSEAEWNLFSNELAETGIRAVRGGQFIHLMGNADKADGQLAAKAHCEIREPDTPWLTVALGDSPNDLGMLNAADIAVAIKNPRHHTHLQPTAPECIYPENFGPVAWNAAILTILTTIK